MLKSLFQYVVGLGNESEKVQIVDICGETYANKNLIRYGAPKRANAIEASSLSSLVDYIEHCAEEFEYQKLIIQIENPKKVSLISFLDAERKRECLFECRAQISDFQFDKWYDQERFMIEAQSNFLMNEDLELIMKLAGNVEKRNNTAFSDDGRTQVVSASVGVASKADVIVPNPVTLIPFRTFQEVQQPESKFVFRIGDKEEPLFKLIEAENGIWKNAAINNIKEYLYECLVEMPVELREKITIIG